MPTISVILCTYNRPAELLQAATESILAQSFADLELIVVDDGSTATNPAQALASQLKKDARLQLIRQENRGLAAARNTGIAKARCDLIAFQDDDDISLPERLQAQYDFLQQHREIVGISCECENIPPSSRPATIPATVPAKDRAIESPTKPATPAQGAPARIQPPQMTLRRPSDFRRIILTNASVLIRRTALEAVGGYREFLRVHEDLDLSLRLQEKFTLALLPECYYRCCPHEQPRMTKAPISWQYYCAIIASAWLRRNRDAAPLTDSLQEAGDTSLAALFRLTLQTPAWLRGYFIWHARKIIKSALRNGEHPTIEATMQQCVQLSGGFAGWMALRRLKFRLLLWSLWYGR